MNPSEKLERPPLYINVPLWIILGLNIILNLSGAGLIVSYLVSAKTPNVTSTILPILSVILTLISAVGTGLMRRWAAIVFVVLTVIGMLPLFAGRLNAPGLTLNFLSCLIVILAFRWMR
jgi:hypothetical protein